MSARSDMNHELVDICFNFTHSSFRRDEQAVLERAIHAGVTTLMVTGSSVEESFRGAELAELEHQHGQDAEHRQKHRRAHGPDAFRLGLGLSAQRQAVARRQRQFALEAGR